MPPWVAPSQRPLDQLHGVVIDRDRWVPVAGASLQIVARLPQTRGTIAARDDHTFQADVRTDAEGRFAVDAPAGRYRIFASTEEGLRGLTDCATTGVSGTPVTVEVRTPHPLDDKVFLETVDADGAPVADVRVTLAAGDRYLGAIGFGDEPPLVGTSDRDGHCVLAAPGRMHRLFEGLVFATAPDGRAGRARIARPEHGNGRPCLRIVVDRPATLSGTLTAPAEALVDLQVTAHATLVYGDIYPDCPPAEFQGTVEGDRYRIEGLPAGRYTLRFRSPAGATYDELREDEDGELDFEELHVRVAASEDAEKDLELTIGATVQGVVTDTDGTPIPDATVAVRRTWSHEDDPVLHHAPSHLPIAPRGEQTTRTGPDGRFVLRGVQPGPHHVVAAAPGYGEVLRATKLRCGEMENADFVLRPGGRVEVLARSGTMALQPVGAGARADEELVLFWTSPTGATTVPLVAAGEYRVGSWEEGDFLPLRDVSVRAGETVWIDLRDVRLVPVTGRVRSGDQPVAGATVQLGEAGPKSVTDATGHFELHRHPHPHHYQGLFVLVDGITAAHCPPSAFGAPLDVELVERPLKIAFRDRAGEPTSGCLQWTEIGSYDGPSGRLHVDREHVVRFAGRSRLLLHGFFASGARVERVVDTSPDSTDPTEIVFQEPPHATLEFDVVDHHGRPAIGRSFVIQTWNADTPPPGDEASFAKGATGWQTAVTDLRGRLVVRGVSGSHALVHRGGRMQERYGFSGWDKTPPWMRIVELVDGGTVHEHVRLPEPN